MKLYEKKCIYSFIFNKTNLKKKPTMNKLILESHVIL